MEVQDLTIPTSENVDVNDLENMNSLVRNHYQFWTKWRKLAGWQNALKKSSRLLLTRYYRSSGSFQNEELLANLVFPMPGYAVMCSDRFSSHLMGRTQLLPGQKKSAFNLQYRSNWCIVRARLFEDSLWSARLGLDRALDGYSKHSVYCFFLLVKVDAYMRCWLATAKGNQCVKEKKSDLCNISQNSGSANEDLNPEKDLIPSPER